MLLMRIPSHPNFIIALLLLQTPRRPQQVTFFLETATPKIFLNCSWVYKTFNREWCEIIRILKKTSEQTENTTIFWYRKYQLKIVKKHIKQKAQVKHSTAQDGEVGDRPPGPSKPLIKREKDMHSPVNQRPPSVFRFPFPETFESLVLSLFLLSRLSWPHYPITLPPSFPNNCQTALSPVFLWPAPHPKGSLIKSAPAVVEMRWWGRRLSSALFPVSLSSSVVSSAFSSPLLLDHHPNRLASTN